MISIIIPCYLDAAHLKANVDRIVRALALDGRTFEIVFVDDKSPDDTLAVIEAIIPGYPLIKMLLVRHAENRGRGAAFMTGVAASSGEIVGYLDIDLEVAETYIPKALRLITHGGADLALGSRAATHAASSVFRFLLSRANRVLVSLLLGLPYRHDSGCGFKFFRRERLLAVAGLCRSAGWFWDTEIVCFFHGAGWRILDFSCVYTRRPGKKSTVRWIRDSLEGLRSILAFRTFRALRTAVRQPRR